MSTTGSGLEEYVTNQDHGEGITLGTSLAEAYDKVLLYVHLPPQLSYHTGNYNPTCNGKT